MNIKGPLKLAVSSVFVCKEYFAKQYRLDNVKSLVFEHFIHLVVLFLEMTK